MIKFPVRKTEEAKTSTSITWSNDAMAYICNTEGITREILVVNRDELFQIKSGHIKKIYPEFTENMYYSLDTMVGKYNKEDSELFSLKIKEYISENDLPYGVFKLKQDHYGRVLFIPFKSELKESSLLVKNNDLVPSVKKFFTTKEGTVRKNKMGMLLYGPPGNGKTSNIMSLFKLCNELALRIFLIPSDFSLRALSIPKSLLEQDNNIVVIEEITERLGRQELEEILTFLDGEDSWNNTISIATTNYPEDMPANLVDRPGRFETFIEYAPPSKEQIEEMLEKSGFLSEDSSVLYGNKLSFDYISHIINQAQTKGMSIKESYDLESSKRKKISETFKGRLGRVGI